MGLQPITRRVWAKKGNRPIAHHWRRYQWLYAYNFVHPFNGDNFWLLLPQVNTEVMTIALKEFDQYSNPKKNKLIILLLDQAGWHTSPDTAVDKTIRNFPLLPYTPTLQPVECAWPLLKESVANKAYATLDELEAVLIPRCQWLNAHPEVVKGAVGFEWIEKIEHRIN